MSERKFHHATWLLIMFTAVDPQSRSLFTKEEDKDESMEATTNAVLDQQKALETNLLFIFIIKSK